jgi:glycosyltransferase involved in cell wall biosynthesis
MDSRFVMVTAAKNEEKYIGNAIASVIRQTIRPAVWYIVDDASTDRTPDIVNDYSKQHEFIRLIRNERKHERNFGAQYDAINGAYALLRSTDFEFFAVQDADIAVERNDYYEQILAAFRRDDRLGIVGGYIFERRRDAWRCRLANSPDSVAGGIQMFRRACFEAIGGYFPLQLGGADWLAQIEAKRAGWSVTAIPELAAYHYRPTSSADGRLKGLFRLGMMDGSFGCHPVFEAFRCARRARERPFLLGSGIRYGGYLWWRMRRGSTLLPAETVSFLRAEQMTKLRSTMVRAWHTTCSQVATFIWWD